jgi:hypothetical protein
MLNLKRFSPLAVTILLSLNSLTANAGAGGTGGGDAPVSSPEQVKKAITVLKPKLAEWLKVNQVRFLDMTSEGAISKLYRNFYGSTSMSKDAVSIRSINASKIISKEGGPCIDLKGNEKEAAVQEKLEPGSPICFSVAKLQRIPPDQLERQIVALAAHELTHQIMKSLDEAWPLAIQKEVLDTYVWAVIEGNDVPCGVNTFRKYDGEVTGYQINFGWLTESVGRATSISFDKSELSQWMEWARKKRLDDIGQIH